jgi:RpiB/LacA/LacB family sugar-phosphate isomerase
MKIYIGADHRGYKLKEKLEAWLKKEKHEVEDMGAFEFDPEDDYTLYAEKVALMVRDNDGSRGILLCGSGVGVDVVANKFDGIRASIGKTAKQVRAGREDDDMNILVIAADFTEDSDAKNMTKVFLEAKFDKEARHKRRLQDIKRIEANN